MSKRLAILVLLVAGTAAAGTALTRRSAAPGTQFESNTELAAIIERVRPNNIVLHPILTGKMASPLSVIESGSLEHPTKAIHATWARARAAVARFARTMHEGGGEPATAYTSAPCGPWREVGRKAVEGSDDTAPRSVRDLCDH
jgi:hypothetical protein